MYKMRKYVIHPVVGLVALTMTIPPALAQQSLPYNPTRVFTAQSGDVAYIFSPSTSASGQFSLSLVDTSAQVNSSSTTTTLFSTLPFLSSNKTKAFTPVVDQSGITVLAGDCSSASDKLELWRYQIKSANPAWSQLQVVSSDTTSSANFLAAGFAYSPTSASNDYSTFVFGGMCPIINAETASTWTSDAVYSNTMLTFSPKTANGPPYQLSTITGATSPIAEAGLTITALTQNVVTSSSAGQPLNLILLGGHTKNAFINMSQAAIFSLPQQSWSFVNIQDPSSNANTELLARAIVSVVEPRSGHTAILSSDGSRIIILGGWVGDVSTPAQPQLAVLQIGAGYASGSGNWAWSIPVQNGPLSNGQGVYGHGAALLPGGVMMVVGGYQMSSSGSKIKRDTANLLFFNTTSLTWIDSYISPYSPLSPAYIGAPNHNGLSTGQKVGLGVGITLGLLAIIAIVVFWVFYRKKLRAKRVVREKELRAQALGTERYHSPTLLGDDYRYHGRRSLSWGTPQKAAVENSNNAFPWAPIVSPGEAGKIGLEKEDADTPEMRKDERSGLLFEVPVPARNLRRSLNSRGPGAYDPAVGTGAVFRIDEEDETSAAGSLRHTRTPPGTSGRDSRLSDPFKDPPLLLPTSTDPAAESRRKEVAGWVEDWNSAAESMSLSRQPSQAYSRTYSNLSAAHSHSHSSGTQSGRGSPDKSDRTGSNLSERSIVSTASFNRSINPMSRNTSQRSTSAGYALFAGASAAMSRLAGPRMGQTNQSEVPQTLARSPSIRSVSLNIDNASEKMTQTRERGNTFSSIRTSTGPLAINDDATHEKGYWTPPESPIKEKYPRTSSMTSTGRKALGILGSVRRVFTGTGGVDVHHRVASLEARSGSSSPIKHVTVPEMADRLPRRTSSAGATFLRSQQGAKDWDAGTSAVCNSMTSTTTAIRRKRPSDQFPDLMDDGPFTSSASAGLTSGPSTTTTHHAPLTDDEDWDIETAVQKRVVQVMFTVPKEKLRVVNADALSLLSSRCSEVDGEDDKEREKEKDSMQVKRMSSVREHDEEMVLDSDGFDVVSGQDRDGGIGLAIGGDMAGELAGGSAVLGDGKGKGKVMPGPELHW